jgi:hypothetical protein
VERGRVYEIEGGDVTKVGGGVTNDSQCLQQTNPQLQSAILSQRPVVAKFLAVQAGSGYTRLLHSRQLMKNIEFLIYRLNYVDARTLFSKRLSSDEELAQVIESATNPDFDVNKKRTKSGFRWALRGFHQYKYDAMDRWIGVVTVARSTVYRKGLVVTEEGIENAVSEANPPLADTSLMVIDFNRHLFAVQYDSAMMQSAEWLTNVERILNAAVVSKGYGVRIKLEPLPAKENFETEFRQFQAVTRLRLKLRIPNPDLGPTFERLYRELSEGGIREITQDMRNANGLNFSDNSLPRASLDMALAGYKDGVVNVTGVRNGRRHKIELGKEVVQIEFEELREHADDIATGSDNAEVRKMLMRLTEKLDEALDGDYPNDKSDEA